jgi:protein TonB
VKGVHLLLKLAALLTVILGLVAAATVLSSAAAPKAAGDGHGAAALKAYFAIDFKDPVYQQRAYQKVAAQWKVPSKNPPLGGKAVVIATVNRDGAIAGTTLHMKSGEPAWDEAAVSAVAAASPLPAFPAAYKRASTEVHFHFEWAASPER